MKRLSRAIVASCFLVGLASLAGAWTIKETKTDQDMDFYVSPSGTPTKAMSIDGATGSLNALLGLDITGQSTTTTMVVTGTGAAGDNDNLIVRRGDATVQGVFGYNGTDTTMYVGTTTNHPFVLRSNDTERMRIDSGGNVGIGTTSPTYLLEASSSVPGNWIARIFNTSATGFGLQVTSASNSVSQEVLKVRTNTSTDKFIIYGNGQVAAAGGSVSAPAFSILGDLNTGIFSPGADQIAFSGNGVNIGETSPAGAWTLGPSGGGVQHVIRGTAYLSLGTTRLENYNVNVASTGNWDHNNLNPTTGYINFITATSPFAVHGIGTFVSDGHMMVINNASGQTMSIVCNSSSEGSSSSRIEWSTTAGSACTQNNSIAFGIRGSVMAIYNGTLSRWILMGRF